jgi:hypothetical protein
LALALGSGEQKESIHVVRVIMESRLIFPESRAPSSRVPSPVSRLPSPVARLLYRVNPEIISVRSFREKVGDEQIPR